MEWVDVRQLQVNTLVDLLTVVIGRDATPVGSVGRGNHCRDTTKRCHAIELVGRTSWSLLVKQCGHDHNCGSKFFDQGNEE